MAHWKNTFRDRMVLFWLFGFPVLFIFLFGTIFDNTGGSFSLKVRMVEKEQTSFGETLTKDLKESGMVELFPEDSSVTVEVVQKGKQDLVFVVGEEEIDYLLPGILAMALIITTGWLFFQVKVLGSLSGTLFWVLFGSLTFVSLGYCLTSFTRTIESAESAIQMVQFPTMFFREFSSLPKSCPSHCDLYPDYYLSVISHFCYSLAIFPVEVNHSRRIRA